MSEQLEMSLGMPEDNFSLEELLSMVERKVASESDQAFYHAQRYTERLYNGQHVQTDTYELVKKVH